MTALYIKLACRFEYLHGADPSFWWQAIHMIGHPFGL